MSLSSLFVQREVATMRQVEEALARQVIYGGDLVTNLLEVARVDEGVLAQLLAESMDLAAAPPGKLPRAPDAVRALVPLEIALERSLAPLEATADTLVLAVAEALPPDVKEELSFALGMRIEQRAAPAVRVWQAIASGYGAPLERRMQRLVARLSGDPASAGASLPPPLDARNPSSASRPRSTPPPRAATSSTPSVAPIAGAGSMRPTPGRRRTLTNFPAGRIPSPSIGPRASQPVAKTESAAPRVGGESRPPLLHRTAPPNARAAGRRRRGPLTLEIARREADEATTRDALLDLLFDFSRQFFEYCALFLVQSDIAEGRDGFGSGATRERVLGIGVPLDLPSLLSRAREARVPVVGSAGSDGLDSALLADLQRPPKTEIVVLPLVVRTRAVALLVGDCGAPGVDREAVHEVTAFCGVVSKAFERIIVRRKLEGFVAGSRGRRDDSMFPGDASTYPPVAAETPVEVAALLSASRGRGKTSPLPDGILPPPVVAAPPPLAVSEPIFEGNADESDGNLGDPSDDLGDPPGPPPSEPTASAISVPPRLPPSPSYPASDALPSIIVDLQSELAALVDRLLAGETDDHAEGELLRHGEHAMPVLMARFPGPLTFDRSKIPVTDPPPKASECGPLLRLIARQRRVALPFVLARTIDPDDEARGWATHLLGEFPYVEALPTLLTRLQDTDESTRTSAAVAVGVLAKASPEAVTDALRILATGAEPATRAAALRAAGEVRQAGLVPELIRALADAEESVVLAAHGALVRTTRQDFGPDPRPWGQWWSKNGGRQRLEWLIDALSHDAVSIRKAAGDELRTLSRQYFSYASDLPPRDRERVQQRYRDWWITEGRSSTRWA